MQSSSCAGFASSPSAVSSAIVGSQSSIVELLDLVAVGRQRRALTAPLARVHEPEVGQAAGQHQSYGVAVLARRQQPGAVGHVADDLRPLRIGQRDRLDPGAEARTGAVRRLHARRLLVDPHGDHGVAGQHDLALLEPGQVDRGQPLGALTGDVVDDQLVVVEPGQQRAVGLDDVGLVDADLLDVGAGVAVLLARGLRRTVGWARCSGRTDVRGIRRLLRVSKVQVTEARREAIDTVGEVAILGPVGVGRIPPPRRDPGEPAIDVRRQQLVAGLRGLEVGLERDRGRVGGAEVRAASRGAVVSTTAAVDERAGDERADDAGGEAGDQHRPHQEPALLREGRGGCRPPGAHDVVDGRLADGQVVPEVFEVGHRDAPPLRSRMWSFAASWARDRDRRLLTVPAGTPSTSAVCRSVSCTK